MTRPASRLHHRAVLAIARAVLTLRHPLMVARFATKLGYLPNPAVPGTYHERLMWRKLLDRNPLFVTLTDKLTAKDYVAARFPALLPPATLWRGQDPAAIPAELLEGDVVVKANHGSGMNLFVSGGEPGRAQIIAEARRWLGRRYGRGNGEWAYRGVQPTIFVEERLALGHAVASDIKVHVCSGTVCHVWAEDKDACLSHLFDRDGIPLPGRDSDYPREDQSLPPGERLRTLVRQAAEIAPHIAGDLDYVRIDFLVTETGLRAGEITVYSASGHGTWTNPAILRLLERHWQLRRSHYMQTPHSGLARLYVRALEINFTSERDTTR